MIDTANAFSAAADKYDDSFTNSFIGRTQRQAVWNFLTLHTDMNFTHVLELNCGTGEDAIWLSKTCKKIIATDISERMVSIAKKRISNTHISHVECLCMGFSDLENVLATQKFDLIFSNFGGLNCVDEHMLQLHFRQLNKLLQPGGKIVLVLMGKYCLWESLYFFLKGKLQNAMRRWQRNGVDTVIENISFNTWYFSVTRLKKMLPSELKTTIVKPIAIAVPPSYLEPFFSKHEKTLYLLQRLDSFLNKFTFLADFSDHFVMMIEPQKP